MPPEPNQSLIADAAKLSAYLSSGRAFDALAVLQQYEECYADELRELVSLAIPNSEIIYLTRFDDSELELFTTMLSNGLAADFRVGGVDYILARIMNDHNPHGVGSEGLFKLFLSFGANPNAIALGGGTLPMLHYAVQEHANSFIEPLLRSGADARLASESGWDAYQMCARAKNSTARQILDRILNG